MAAGGETLEDWEVDLDFESQPEDERHQVGVTLPVQESVPTNLEDLSIERLGLDNDDQSNICYSH